ncbi:ribonuclease P protein subunit p29 [Sipha flava]|uniref:Ribonuclease P protein subunit p29 n=1 Tax=Sipha flava TaxID=143950 RepID=A0A2S2PVG8_9HEMI|nr:ribonuclease P protein subunit p29 [Sipha flava]XP_025408284.1 ribonuclease P protein subunit p29 [Sipha flava]XP_025408285.1 ribonuclease P protein subunit p29 [Sipha flava]XP_025408286.1 ribonuclease P protein subunit p29 [Sipha flava]
MSNILYAPLSQATFESSAVAKVESPLTVTELARQLLPLKVTNKEIDSGLKRIYWLGNYTHKKKSKSVDNCKQNNQLKRILGLSRPPKNVLSYLDAMKLNELWVSYIKKIINFDDLRKRGWDGTPGCKHWEALLTSLYKCDFHGAHIKVISSKCCSYIMVAGVIILETKNTFQIIGVDNKLKTIPKEQCIFELNLEGYFIQLYGKHFIIRSKDRSKKKLKENLILEL